MSQIPADSAPAFGLEVLPKAAISKIIKSSVPDWEWFLGELEAHENRYCFPEYFSRLIPNLKIENYPLLYENEYAIAAMLLRGFMTTEEIQNFSSWVESLSLDERGEFLLELCESADSIVESIEIPKTPEQQRKANEIFLALSDEEKKSSIKLAQHIYSFFFASFYENLSIMVHGEKLTALVSQAKAGNDKAFVKAVQIDRRILVAIPYFREKFANSQSLEGQEFSKKLAYRIRCPAYLGEIRFKSLWLAFSVLDHSKLLDTMPHNEMLDLLNDAGVGGHKNRIEDVKYLSARLRDYRRFQKRGIATP